MCEYKRFINVRIIEPFRPPCNAGGGEVRRVHVVEVTAHEGGALFDFVGADFVELVQLGEGVRGDDGEGL